MDITLTADQKQALSVAAGISVRTVGRYLANPESVGPDTRMKLIDLIANMDFGSAAGEVTPPADEEWETPPPPAADQEQEQGLDGDPADLPQADENQVRRGMLAQDEFKALKAWEKARSEGEDAGPRPHTPNYDKVVEIYMKKQANGGKLPKGSGGKGGGKAKGADITPEPAKQRGFTNVALKGLRAAAVALEAFDGEFDGTEVFTDGSWLVVKNSEAAAVLDALVNFEAPGPYAKRLAVLDAVAVMHAFPKVTTDSKAPVYAVVAKLRELGLTWKPMATSDSKPAFLVTQDGTETLYEKISEAVDVFGVERPAKDTAKAASA